MLAVLGASCSTLRELCRKGTSRDAAMRVEREAVRAMACRTGRQQTECSMVSVHRLAMGCD